VIYFAKCDIENLVVRIVSCEINLTKKKNAKRTQFMGKKHEFGNNVL
jgi:hypothetical protein